jgi:UrcA family protein
MKSFKLLVPAIALVVSGFAAAGTRVAADVPSVVVQYGDLNLNSKAGVVRMHARLKGAAQAVCDSLNSRVLGLREQYDRCVVDAISDGVKQVGNQNLSNFHRYGRVSTAVAKN